MNTFKTSYVIYAVRKKIKSGKIVCSTIVYFLVPL